MKYYSQYRSHDLCELQESLSGLSKSNRWVKLADHFPWGRIEKEYNKRRRNNHNGAGNKPGRYVRLTLLYTYNLGWFYKLALLDFELIFEVKMQESEGM